MSKHQKVVIIVALVCLISGFISGVYVGKLRGAPFVTKKDRWSIGIYVGDSPLNLVSPEDISNPVLTTEHVTDVSAKTVADPFIIHEDQTWYMFFEVFRGYTMCS